MLFEGRMQYAPTRVHEKSVRFHISASEYAKNAPDFTLPNKDTPKTRLVLHPNLRRGSFRGVLHTPLHGYVQKTGGFHISSHGYTENAPDFIPPNKDSPKTHSILGANPRRGTFRGVCFCTPTRVRAKFGGFHISAHGYAKNAPDFTLPNKDSPKTRPVLGANLRRRTFRGVCFCAPTRVYEKPARF